MRPRHRDDTPSITILPGERCLPRGIRRMMASRGAGYRTVAWIVASEIAPCAQREHCIPTSCVLPRET
jgi:hypothetical protein